MDCFGTYFTHVQTCDEIRVHSTCSEARLDKKCDENAADTTAKRKTPQKTNPVFRAQKIWTCFNSMQITMFQWRFFSAHCNCADFKEFLKLQCYKTMRISAFFCCSQQMFFNKVMHPHARKTVRRVVFVQSPLDLAISTSTVINLRLKYPVNKKTHLQILVVSSLFWRCKRLKDLLQPHFSMDSFVGNTGAGCLFISNFG